MTMSLQHERQHTPVRHLNSTPLSINSPILASHRIANKAAIYGKGEKEILFKLRIWPIYKNKDNSASRVFRVCLAGWHQPCQKGSVDAFSPVFIHTHRLRCRPKTTLLAWPSSLKRRGRGGSGLSSSTPAESCDHSLPPSPSSTRLSLSASARSNWVSFPPIFVIWFLPKVPTCFEGLRLRFYSTFVVTPDRVLDKLQTPACCSGHGGSQGSPPRHTHTSPSFFFFPRKSLKRRLQRSLNERTGTMTRRSCALYATGIVSAHLLIVGIALVVAQVFQTMIHERLKKVSDCLDSLVTFHFVTFRGFKCSSADASFSITHYSSPKCGLFFTSTCMEIFF